MGFAAVFAAAPSDSTEGTQTIGCSGRSEPVLTATATARFEGRNTNFYATSDANLTTDDLVVTFADGRGYDPDVTDCGNGYSVSISSPGLVQGSTTLNMKYVPTSAIPDCTGCDGASVITAGVTGGVISTNRVIFSSTEAFLGTYTYTFPKDTDALYVAKDSVSGPIAQGDYTGTITFSAI
jgi:hypothetical protein